MVKTIERAPKTVPPYLSYKTFRGFLDQLKTSGVPGRMDVSVVPSMSGSNQALLFSSLRYFTLITNLKATTKDLETLVNANEDTRPAIWRQLFKRGYAKVLASVDVEKATTQQLVEAFRREGVSSTDTARKCVTFFCLAAAEAEIKISLLIKPYAGRRKGARGKRMDHSDQTSFLDNPDSIVSADGNGSTPWQMLVSKLPKYQESWSEDRKKIWFDNYDRLVNSYCETTRGSK